MVNNRFLRAKIYRELKDIASVFYKSVIMPKDDMYKF